MPAASDDNLIIELYWNRDEQAIAVTGEKYGGYCYKIAVNILNDGQDAEETVNDAYYKVWNSIPPTRPQCFSAYIGRIVRNISINKLNARHTQKRIACEYSLSLEELDGCIPSRARDDDADGAELSRIINGFLSKQKKTNRIIFVRRYFRFDPISDIASDMDMTESKVTSVLHRMRKKLKRVLEVSRVG